MCQMKASLINIPLTSGYSAASYAFAVKGFCALFRSRSGPVHSFTAALTCLRSVQTNLTLTCPSPKSFVCNLPDSGRHITSVFQGLSLSRSLGRVGENPGNEVVLLCCMGAYIFISSATSFPSPKESFKNHYAFATTCAHSSTVYHTCVFNAVYNFSPSLPYVSFTIILSVS